MSGNKEDPIRLLILVDDPDDRLRMIRELDREFGFLLVEQVRSQEEFERILESFPYEVAVCGHPLGWSGGLKVPEELKRRFPHRPVVLFAASGNEELAVEAMKRGCDDYVPRSPEDCAGLCRAVAEARKRGPARQNADSDAARLRAMLERLGVGTFCADVRGNLRETNRDFLELLGIPDSATVEGLSLGRFLPADQDLPVLTQTLEASGHLRWNDFPMRRLQGDRIWASLSVVLNRGSDGEIVMEGFVEDVTERKHAEETLKESAEKLWHAQKMEAVGRLAGGIAHDFNNILTAINGYSDLLLHSLDNPDLLRSGLEEIKRAGFRAAGLTRQLLMFSRRQILQPDILDVNQVVLAQDRMLRRLIGEHIELVTLLGQDLPRIKIDPVQLEQVILNLAINARDAMGERGKLIIETARDTLPGGNAPETTGVRLSVSDTGCGMDSGTLAHLFEPFFTTKGGRGSGMGLATVYGIVKQNEGHIQVSSQPGKGSNFHLFLPAAAEQQDAQVAIAQTPKGLRGRETVLLVEDEDAVRLLALRILSEGGYRVLEAGSGHEALNICREQAARLDLAITDLVMPQMSGRELAQFLREMRPDLPVLYISGYTDDLAVREDISAAEVHFLPKPFTADVLLRTVRHVLDVHQGKRQVA